MPTTKIVVFAMPDLAFGQRGEIRCGLVGQHDHSAHGAGSQCQLARLAAEQRDDRHPGALCGIGVGERRCFRHVHPDVERDGDQHSAEQKRHTPAPVQERCTAGAQKGMGQQEHQVGQHQCRAEPQLGEHACIRALFAGSAFGAEQRRAGPFPADGEALQQPHGDQQQRGRDTDCGRAGDQADGERRGPHDEQGDDQGALAAHPVTEVTEEHCPDGPGQEGAGEAAERGHRRHRRTQVREEDGGEHQRGSGAVDEEVVELDRRADIAGKGGPSHAVAVAVGGVRLENDSPWAHVQCLHSAIVSRITLAGYPPADGTAWRTGLSADEGTLAEPQARAVRSPHERGVGQDFRRAWRAGLLAFAVFARRGDVGVGIPVQRSSASPRSDMPG